MAKFKTREILEIIIDTCSLGPKQLDEINQLITHAMSSTPRIFNDYRIVMPVQIATEARQRIFPEFLDAELLKREHREKPSRLREFYQAHRSHIDIVETDVSIVYKMMYAQKAIMRMREDPSIMDSVLAKAQSLAAEYNPHLHIDTLPNREDLENFCHNFERSTQLQRDAFTRTRDGILKHAKVITATHKPITSDLLSAEFTSTARHGSRFLKTMSANERYCLQAMYSNPSLYKALTDNDDFRQFRRDKGERAIESYLFQKRVDYDPSVVSLVVSQDTGARQSIKSLRDQSHNTVLVVNNYGLETALMQMNNPTPEIEDTIKAPHTASLTPQQKWAVDPKNSRSERLVAAKQAQQLAKSTLPTPASEGEWARRLAEVMRYGSWKPHHRAKFSSHANSLHSTPHML